MVALMSFLDLNQSHSMIPVPRNPILGKNRISQPNRIFTNARNRIFWKICDEWEYPNKKGAFKSKQVLINSMHTQLLLNFKLSESGFSGFKDF
ncbi:MAG: hypothetical protein DRR19_17105 [Candidatus Parabeggiatoa sp. nov. 1]|nr:MAG: hypothetical protein DRR19_17105 [Gammaproteobacteria bacterium]